MASSTPSPSANEPLPPVGGFRTTHWSAVLLAGRDSLPDARAALEELCRSYWYPLYAFARRKGCGHEDAQDLVQGFFAQLLARRDLADVHPDKGRFRTFLLSSLGHFMANEWDRAQAQKRGGGIQFVTLEPGDSDERYLRGARLGYEPGGSL
jgi:DNA-directed RNA polymerase specialized sigma24 family protein